MVIKLSSAETSRDVYRLTVQNCYLLLSRYLYKEYILYADTKQIKRKDVIYFVKNVWFYINKQS